MTRKIRWYDDNTCLLQGEISVEVSAREVMDLWDKDNYCLSIITTEQFKLLPFEHLPQFSYYLEVK